MQWNEAQQRGLKLRQKRMFLEGQRESIEKQRQQNLSLSVEAQNRIQSDEMVKEVLGRLQHREHERSVGAYEQLLGAFLSDVLPGERQIVMDLHTDRSAPALDIFIKKGEHMPLEDAWLGTGGSVTNLLSTGLRLVALLRSGQRRFLVLDESDCWIKPTLIPQYASIVQQMSEELGVQILMISHHDESLFAQHIPYRLRLTKNSSGLLNAEWSPTSDIPQWGIDERGLRYIGLKDFQSHQNTLIPLSSGVTLLQGDNDIGKSAVVNALRAVFDADANDTLIKHHAHFAQVTLDFGPEHLLVWQRFRKGKIKCSYKLLNGDTQEVIHASDGTKTPEWLSDTLKVGKVDGLDVQIGQQQDPVFLLNQPASTRAKALSIGQESGHVNNMMLFDRQELSEAKSALKLSERQLEDARRKLHVLDQLSTHHLDDFDDTLGNAQERNDQYKSVTELLRRWKTADDKHTVLENLTTVDLILPVPQSEDLSHLVLKWTRAKNQKDALQAIAQGGINRPLPRPQSEGGRALLQRWVDAQHKNRALQAVNESQDLKAPVVRDNSLAVLVRRWATAQDKYTVLKRHTDLAPLELPAPQQKGEYAALIASWKNAKEKQMRIAQQSQILETEQQSLEETIHTQFPVCPTCLRNWD